MTEPSAPVPDPTPAKRVRNEEGGVRRKNDRRPLPSSLPPPHSSLSAASAGGKPLAATFRWQAFFGRTADPVFVLDRRRRLLFVNAAWESLTGVPAGDAHRLVCRRPRPPVPAIRPMPSWNTP